MKIKSFILGAFLLSVFTVDAQIKVTTANAIGIGTETPSHSITLDRAQIYMNGYLSSLRSILFKVSDSHPRICADSKLVFYKYNQSGHIALEASAFNTVSDARLKSNIQKLPVSSSSSPLATVLQLNGYSYNMKEDGGLSSKRQIGFLAQEVEKLIPEAVHTSFDSTELKTMSYDQIIPYLVEAVKEQQSIIEGLQRRIEEMEENRGVAVNVDKATGREKLIARLED